MALVVVDSSVLIAFRDPADALHARAVAAFRRHAADDLLVPASVYAELLVGPLRRDAEAVESLELFIHDFAMQIIPLDASIAREAASLRARTTSLRLPDAFVLATGEVLNAGAVLTGDSAWTKLADRVELI